MVDRIRTFPDRPGVVNKRVVVKKVNSGEWPAGGGRDAIGRVVGESGEKKRLKKGEVGNHVDGKMMTLVAEVEKVAHAVSRRGKNFKVLQIAWDGSSSKKRGGGLANSRRKKGGRQKTASRSPFWGGPEGKRRGTPGCSSW